MLFAQNYVKIVITDIVASKIVWLLIWSLTILIDQNLVLKVNNNTRLQESYENKVSNLLLPKKISKYNPGVPMG